MAKRGYFGIGIYHTKNSINVGGLLRSAQAFGAAYVFTIGRRYKHEASDTTNAWRHIPLFHYKTFEDFNTHRSFDTQLVAVENNIVDSTRLDIFKHPHRAVYLLGAEDHGLPPAIVRRCQYTVTIPARTCLNVHVAGSIVMYDRASK